MNGARLTMAVCAVVSVALGGADASAEGGDRLARGLDLFTQVPATVPSGGTLPVQVQAFGFPTATKAVALPGAEIEAAWNPKSLGTTRAAPSSVRVTADDLGRAHLDLPVPVGGVREMELLIAVRAPGHERTRTFKVIRANALELSLFVNDVRVVPGGAASAWITVRSKSTGQPVSGVRVAFDLLEGGTPRFTSHATTDLGGTATARVAIPETDEPGLSWTLRASANAASGEQESTATMLWQRDESPATPRLDVSWAESAVVAGSPAEFRATVRDASGQPVVGLPLRYWAYPEGTSPPAENEEWERVSTLATTDLSGLVVATVGTPSVLATRSTTMTVMVKTMLNGRGLTDMDGLTVGSLLPDLAVVPEYEMLVPGVEQRLLLRARGAHHRPIVAGFIVEGDGLRADVHTDERGNAEFTWKPPRDVGIHRDVGPCAEGVAAAVLVRAVDPAKLLVSHPEPFALCVKVDRDARAVVRPAHPFARAGQPLHFALDGANKGAWSVHLEDGNRVVSGWTNDGERGIDLTLPADSSGVWMARAISPGSGVASGATVLVLPRVLPKIVAKLAAGRAAPSGKVTIAADLLDETGRGLAGSVAAVMIDLNGGGKQTALAELDTRTALATPLLETAFDEVVDRDQFLLAGAAFDPLRRAVLAGRGVGRNPNWSDPAREAEHEMKTTLRDVMRSLEGAVFEGSVSPERAREVRRRTAHGIDFNPELMTLATAAMDSPPLTPGGEPLVLADLVAIDRQISFDNVARRVARLKLLQILTAVRRTMNERELDRDEPLFADPNALLRRMVREGSLADGALLDPWGGTIRFLPSNGPRIPFVTLRGFALHAPGPDGVAGTADDIHDPFARVLKSGTPYAAAMGEDRIVDAKWDMKVADETVTSWQSLLEELTGTSLGGGQSGSGIGLGSISTTGHGVGGGGAGHGALRDSHGIDTGIAYWSAPVRTDARGHVELEVPLGDIETTWRLTLVGIPDHATPATTAIDIPAMLPLSVKVETGARWVEGDRMDVGLILQNRTDAALRASLSTRAAGAASLVSGPTEAAVDNVDLAVDVPPRAIVRRSVGVKALRPGSAALDLSARAGALEDSVHHTWTVVPAGEPIDLTRTVWVNRESRISVPADPAHVRRAGAPSLVLERGFVPSLVAALSSLEPERLSSPSAVVDALEASSLVYRWAITRGGESDTLARRATEVATRAAGRFVALAAAKDRGVDFWPTSARAAAYLPTPPENPASCPLDTALFDERMAWLQAEPPPISATAACWDAFVGSTLQALASSTDPLAIARAVLALAERSHRETEAAILATRLRELVPRTASGTFVFAEPLVRDRAARARVLAALLRTIRLGTDNSAVIPELASWILVQRDAQGGYGSSAATLAVVRALLATPLDDARPVKVSVSATSMGGGAPARDVEVTAGTSTSMTLDAGATALLIRTTGPGLLAQIRAPVVRSWQAPPTPDTSPLSLNVLWPSMPRRYQPAVLKLIFAHRVGRDVTVRARIPLPAGATLAEETTDVRQVRGALHITTHLTASAGPSIVDVPLHFALSGHMTVPEATAYLAREEAPPAYAPARPLTIAPN